MSELGICRQLSTVRSTTPAAPCPLNIALRLCVRDLSPVIYCTEHHTRCSVPPQYRSTTLCSFGLLAASPPVVCAVEVLPFPDEETARDCQTPRRTTMPLQQSRKTAVLSRTECSAYPGTDYSRTECDFQRPWPAVQTGQA